MPLEFEVADTIMGSDTTDATAVIDRPEDMVNGPSEGRDETQGEQSCEPEANGDDEPLTDQEEEPQLTPEQKAAAEEKHRLNIEAATEEHKSLAVQRSEAESELKELKASEKAALKRIIWLTQSGPSYPKPAKPSDRGSGEGAAVCNEDTSWRQIDTSTLLDGIKGMGAKKAELLTELAPTLGDLEDLRAEASVEHEPFHAKLPKGIGQDMADELEERMLNASAGQA